MARNITCPCATCKNIPNIDPKFFVHYGILMNQPLGSCIELVGADVNLVHRLTKNTAIDLTGFIANSMYTKAVVDELRLSEMRRQMTLQVEKYDDVGAIETIVQDVQAVWDRERDRQRVCVSPEEAVVTVEYDFPYSPAVVWDYVTKSEYRAIFWTLRQATLSARAMAASPRE